MSARLHELIIALTRGWVRLYTFGLADDIALSRREEIESDLWEMQDDLDAGGSWRRGVVALRRLIDGMPDDLGWRMEVAPLHEQLITRRLIALAAATVVVVSLWSLPLLLKGRREVAACAEAAPTPTSTAALRHEVLRCAGAFFVRR